MSGVYLAQLHAAAFVEGDDGVANFAVGLASARTGEGVYTLTLSQGLDANEHVPTLVGTDPLTTSIGYVNTSDTVKTVSTLVVAPAAADADFYVALWAINN